jgi:hypothetical protein
MDDIIGEIRKFREAYAERFGFDLAAIFRDVREQERLSGRKVVSLPPKRIVPVVDVPVGEEAEIEPGSSQAPAAVRGS